MKLQKFIDQCKRVLKVTKKPNKKEYSTVAKIAGFGILIFGTLGFIIFLIIQIISG